mmetsp:Transcript_42817/g.87516  ORF Transcript_42817/g.87516 Transcript_42817/m.87516 type:complete len:294 (-) Transcript_42817:341-1222(-)
MGDGAADLMGDGAADLMQGLDISGESGPIADLMGDSSVDQSIDASLLMGNEGGGEGEVFGDDVLRGDLFSPRPGESPGGDAGENDSQLQSMEGRKDDAAQDASQPDADTEPANEEENEPAKEEEFVEDYTEEQASAAIRIQNVQRGARDRKKVKDMKQKGELPGQKRVKRVKPIGKRESEQSVGEIKFYDGIGSHYSGQLLNGRPHGQGEYTFANGNIYKGDFKNGQMHGKGELHFPGYGKYVATFNDGRAVDGSFFFEDGLQYQPQGWKYCVEGDRRFYHEVVDPRFGLTDG